MTKGRRIIRNLIIVALLFLPIISITGASPSPLIAHKRSERSLHYGPSRIVATQKHKGIVFYLCKYDKWYSLDLVRRDFLLMWTPGDFYIADKPDIREPVNFSYGYSDTHDNSNLGRFHGIVNDPAIKSIKLHIKMIDGQTKTLEQQEFHENLFLFVWEQSTTGFESIKMTCYDKDSNIVYEKSVPW